MSAAIEFKKRYSKKGLQEIFDNYIQRDSAIGLDNIRYDVFKRNIEKEIEIIHRKVNSGYYNFTNYKEKLILKNRNSLPRLISIPTLRDKIVLKALQQVIQSAFINENQRLAQKCIDILIPHLNSYDTFIKIDITNFFGNLNHKLLMDKLNKKIRKKEVLQLVQNAINTETSGSYSQEDDIIIKGVPQGLSISNILAQIYMSELDKKYEELKGIFYIRYVDDILILCNGSNSRKIFKEISYDLEGQHVLPINQRKTKIDNLDQGFDFLGYHFIKNDDVVNVNVKKTNQNKFEQSIIDMFTNYKKNYKMSPEQFLYSLNIKITGTVSKKISGNIQTTHTYGWMFYFSKINDTKFLYHLDWLVKKMMANTLKCNRIDINKVKSFVKSYYEVRYNFNESEYIHRPDELSILERKNLLLNVFHVPVGQLTNDMEIEYHYQKLVYAFVREQEKEIQSVRS